MIVAFWGLLSALNVAITVDSATGTVPLSAVFWGAVNVPWISLLVVSWLSGVRIRARGTSGISWDAEYRALVIEDQRDIFRFWVLLLGTLAVLALFGVVVETVAAIKQPDAGLVVVVLLLAALLTGLMWGTVLMMRRGNPRVLLSPDVLRQEGHGTVVELAWTDVFMIRCGGETPDLSIAVLTHGSRLRISGSAVDADPALVAQLLQFYLDHEDARAELGSAASLERVRAGRFTR